MSETTTNPEVQQEEVLTAEQTAVIKKDRLRFAKNKLSSSLCLLAILVNLFYFVSIYKSNVPYYYNAMIGASVLYNLVFMLAVFLSSEGVKNYKFSYGVAVIVVGALQLLRIVYFPVQAHSTEFSFGQDVRLVMETAQFVRVVIYLVLSSALLIAAGVIGILRSKTLEKYRAEIGEEKPA